MDLHAETLADPVPLHGLHPLRPAWQIVEFAQQLVGIGGDAEEIHRDVALLDQGAGAPATSLDYLLVGQNGTVDRIPVHRRHLLVDQSPLEQSSEQPLLPAVVIWRAGRQFTAPIDRQSQALQLPTHVVDVGVGPAGRRHVVGQGGVFRRQSEGIPTHGLQHVVAFHAVIARQHIPYRVVAHVAHVQLARRVGEHGQTIVFWPGGVFRGAKALRVFPMLLSFRLDDFRAVLSVHLKGRPC